MNEIDDVFDENKQISFCDSVYVTHDDGSYANEHTKSRAWSPFLASKSPLLGFEHEIEYSDGSIDESSFDESSIRIAGTPLGQNDKCNSKPNTCANRLIEMRRNSKTSLNDARKAVVAFKQEGANRWSFLGIESDNKSVPKSVPTKFKPDKENNKISNKSKFHENAQRYTEKKAKIVKSIIYELTHH